MGSVRVCVCEGVHLCERERVCTKIDCGGSQKKNGRAKGVWGGRLCVWEEGGVERASQAPAVGLAAEC